MKPIWRRFRPRQGTHNDTRVPTRVYPSRDDVSGKESVYSRAHAVIDQQAIGRGRLWRRHDAHAFDGMIDAVRAQASSSGDPADWLAALVLQAPRAVDAQRSMDTHPGGFHNREARLFELIDFNDTYVSTVLALDEADYATFNDETKRLMDRFCKHVKAPCLTNEQWQAITHGLSREISVYRGALRLGYQARMTSRREDAMGVDMVVTDDEGDSINLDIKTRSSFHFRLQDLHNEGRVSELEREEAEQFGHITVVNGHGSGAVTTTLLRIDEETYGRTIAFALERLVPLKTAIEQITKSIARHA